MSSWPSRSRHPILDFVDAHTETQDKKGSSCHAVGVHNNEFILNLFEARSACVMAIHSTGKGESVSVAGDFWFSAQSPTNVSLSDEHYFFCQHASVLASGNEPLQQTIAKKLPERFIRNSERFRTFRVPRCNQGSYQNLDSRDGRPKSPTMSYAFAYAGITNVRMSDFGRNPECNVDP